ncbi:MAG: MOSC domain-containing protein [Paracoccus sp. (in: a-proteobacteria)]
MTARLAHIRVHPIKTLGGDDLDHVQLSAGAHLPGDRTYAVLHEGALKHLEDGRLTRWLPKAAFLRGAACPALQAVKGGWRGDLIRLNHPDRPDLEIDPENPADQQALIGWLSPLWGADRSAPARLLRGQGPLTDQSQPLVSILSLASLHAIEARLGQDIGLDRWRGNLWIEGWEPFAEQDLTGREIAIGEARLLVRKPIGRCPAVEISTKTGSRDSDMLALLREMTGTEDFGVFAEVVTGGKITRADEVQI